MTPPRIAPRVELAPGVRVKVNASHLSTLHGRTGRIAEINFSLPSFPVRVCLDGDDNTVRAFSRAELEVPDA